MTPAERRFKQAVEQLERYVAIERQFTEGGEDERVQTANGTYPTLAALVERGDRAGRLLESANEVLAAAQDLRDAAAASAQAAADRLAETESARDAAVNETSRVEAFVGVLEYHHGRTLLLGGVAY